MFKSLIRILPLLSGNVMINCTLSDYESTDNKTYQCYVRGTSLDPLSSNIYRKQIKCNLLGSTYDYDLKNFYKYYKDIFYTSSFYWDKSDMMPLNKEQPIINRNVDMEFGCARRSVKNTDHVFEFFAPIYITSVNDLPKSFVIDCTFHTPMKDVSKKIVVNIGSNYDSKKNFFDTSAVEAVIEMVLDINKDKAPDKQPMMIIKSTIPVGYTQKTIYRKLMTILSSIYLHQTNTQL